MIYRPGFIAIAAGLGVALAFAQTPPAGSNAMLDNTRTPVQAEPSKPVSITPEMRGDIMMARKMYREAIEAFAEGSAKDPVLRNKTGIAYHQLMQLDKAQKCYEQAIKLNPRYH